MAAHKSNSSHNNGSQDQLNISQSKIAQCVEYLRKAYEQSLKHNYELNQKLIELRSHNEKIEGRNEWHLRQTQLFFEENPMDERSVRKLDTMYREEINRREFELMDAKQRQAEAEVRCELASRRIEEVAALARDSPDSIRSFLHLQAAVLRRQSYNVSEVPCLADFLEAPHTMYSENLARWIGMMRTKDGKTVLPDHLVPSPEPNPDHLIFQLCTELFGAADELPQMQHPEQCEKEREIEQMKKVLQKERAEHMRITEDLLAQMEMTGAKPDMENKSTQIPAKNYPDGKTQSSTTTYLPSERIQERKRSTTMPGSSANTVSTSAPSPPSVYPASTVGVKRPPGSGTEIHERVISHGTSNRSGQPSRTSSRNEDGSGTDSRKNSKGSSHFSDPNLVSYNTGPPIDPIERKKRIEAIKSETVRAKPNVYVDNRKKKEIPQSQLSSQVNKITEATEEIKRRAREKEEEKNMNNIIHERSNGRN